MDLTPDASDPIASPFEIGFDHTRVVESDIDTHAVNYSVSLKEYSMTSTLDDVFNLEVLCPESAAINIENSMQPQIFYDILASE